MRTYLLIFLWSIMTSVPVHSAGFKRVCVLKADTSLLSQIKTENTIYKVCSNFNLRGAEIAMPKD